MILTGEAIAGEFLAGRIAIEPFTPQQLNTNSYDLTLGSHYLYYLDEVIDPAQPSAYCSEPIPEQGLLLKPGQFVLAASAEQVGSKYFVPILHAKSSTARCGLFVHITADLIDIGSFGQLTLQLYATLPIRIYPGMLIAQVSFWQPQGEIRLYQGKYQHSQGPQPSHLYKDPFFEGIRAERAKSHHEENA